MKSSVLLPALTALIGFSIAWVAKPGAAPAPVAGQVEANGQQQPTRSGANSRGSSGENKRPKEGKAGEFPLADLAEQGPKTRDEAKMLRLTEALGLSIEQQGSIISLVEGVQATTSDAIPVIDDLALRGKAIEDGLAKLLTPEQLAKFQELRVRERENRIELRSQRLLTQAIEDIDFTPEQREEVLSRLRQKSKADLQSIPAAATLLFDKSMLPTGKKELSVEGVLLLAQMGKQNAPMDPTEGHQQVLNQQREELEEILRCFDGVLTPGQMGQYQAAVAEQRAILNSLPHNPFEKPAP